jgi:hypothetical protein
MELVSLVLPVLCDEQTSFLNEAVEILILHEVQIVFVCRALSVLRGYSHSYRSRILLFKAKVEDLCVLLWLFYGLKRTLSFLKKRFVFSANPIVHYKILLLVFCFLHLLSPLSQIGLLIKRANVLRVEIWVLFLKFRNFVDLRSQNCFLFRI